MSPGKSAQSKTCSAGVISSRLRPGPPCLHRGCSELSYGMALGSKREDLRILREGRHTQEEGEWERRMRMRWKFSFLTNYTQKSHSIDSTVLSTECKTQPNSRTRNTDPPLSQKSVSQYRKGMGAGGIFTYLFSSFSLSLPHCMCVCVHCAVLKIRSH
jgi:hypothetical protein